MRKCKVLIFLSFFVYNFFVFAHTFSLSSLEEIKKKIEYYYNNKDYSTAFFIARKAIRKYPSDEELKRLMEKSYLKSQRKAETLLEKIKEITRKDALLEIERASLPISLNKDKKNKKIKASSKQASYNTIDTLLKQRISLKLKSADLGYIFDILFRTTGVNIIVDESLIKGKKLSIYVHNMRVSDIIKYITRSTKLTYTIENNTVWITSAKNPVLIPRVYRLRQGITSIGKNILYKYQTSGMLPEKHSNIEKMMAWIEKWPTWPKGGTWRLDPKNNTLFVLTTDQIHDSIKKFLEEVDSPPVQIAIKARFVEIGVDDLSELGFSWYLTNNWPTTHKKDRRTKTQIDTNSGFKFSDFENADEGFNFSFQGVLTVPQFRTILHALQQTQNADTLSAPSVTALNNEMAVIKFTNEYTYPTNYQPVSSTTTSSSTATTVVSGFVPTDFEKVDDEGITLTVIPSVGEDKRQILLTLHPKIKTFREYQEYNIVYTISGETRTQTIKRPVFSTREVTTKALIESSQTVVLGGLMSKNQAINTTKIPFFGDLPVLGFLFRKKTTSDQKSNLLIFVTATIINAAGQRIDLEK